MDRLPATQAHQTPWNTPDTLIHSGYTALGNLPSMEMVQSDSLDRAVIRLRTSHNSL